jgi:hypothetical protein
VSLEEEALVQVVQHLERLAIPYMVTGSLASSFHGRPRSTHDVDVVIDPAPEALRELVVQLERSGFYVDASRAADALRRRLQFNAIDTRSGCKIDLIIRRDRPHSREELGRRRRVSLPGGSLVELASPEDTILSKLEWAKKAGGSEKQIQDAAGVLEVTDGVDRAYVEKWARELGVTDLWRRISRRQDADLPE